MLGYRVSRPNYTNITIKVEPGVASKSKEISKLEKYKRKYERMKRMVKEMIFENAALCDQIAILQEKTLQIIEERNYLWKKLQQYQPYGEAEEGRYRGSHGLGTETASNKKSSKKKSDRAVHEVSDTPKSSKSSSKKSNPITKRKKIVKTIPLDSNGKPIFPIVLGDFTVHSLGEVCDKPEYHNEDLIFPIGYCSTRIYGSLKDPEKQCVYTCKVMDGGNSPRFEIVADTDLDVPIVSNSIDECHSMLLSFINNCLGAEVVNTKGRGADFFGLSHPNVHNLIQASPGVRRCKGYLWTKFEVNPNHQYTSEDAEASLSYTALLRSISFSKSHLENGQDKDDEAIQSILM